MSKLIVSSILILGCCFLGSCKAQPDSKNVTNETGVSKMISEVLSLEEYKKRIASGDVQLVDVRTPEEVAEGKIMDAAHVDYNGADFNTKIEAFKKDEPIYIYCRSGNRSGKSAVIMQDLGFKEIYDLEGGYDAWSAANQ